MMGAQNFGPDSQNWVGIMEMVRRTATARGRAASGYFSIEGTRLHERALRAGIFVEQAVVAAHYWQDVDDRKQKLLVSLAESGCRLTVVPDGVVSEFTGGRDLGAILGLVALPSAPSLRDVLTAQGDNQLVLLVALDVVDPGNVGALVRTAHAGGAAAFIAVGVSDPFHPKALRTTMGSLFKLPILHYTAVSRLLQDLNKNNVCCLGTAVADAIPPYDLPELTGPVAIFMGSEAWGLADDVLAKMDHRVTIPMVPGVDSYSVNAAAAIMLYEMQRRQLT